MSEALDAVAPRQRVLMLTHRVPYPPDRGDRIRSYHLARVLSRHFDLDLAATSDEDTSADTLSTLSDLADRVAIQRISWLVGRVRGGIALGTGHPITPAIFYRRALARTIRAWHRAKPFDAVLTFCTGMSLYSRNLRDEGGFHGRHVLDLVDVDSVKWQNYASMTNPPMKLAYAAEARLLREIEAGHHDRFDAITVVSDAEAQAYRGTVRDNAPLHVVTNGVDLDYFTPQPEAENHTLVFIGVLNYKPNAQGLAWFIDGVLPGLRRRVPDARLVVVGKHPTRATRALGEREGVELVGQVDDVRRYLRDAAAVIAPLRVAMGVQNKVLEAMAAGRAVVSSPAAARGLQIIDGEHLLLADDPGQWVDRCEDLLTDAALRQRLAAAGRRLVETRYAWDTCLAPMVELLRL